MKEIEIDQSIKDKKKRSQRTEEEVGPWTFNRYFRILKKRKSEPATFLEYGEFQWLYEIYHAADQSDYTLVPQLTTGSLELILRFSFT